jgi:diguanylate cyclase (GGDEF)-like protein
MPHRTVPPPTYDPLTRALTRPVFLATLRDQIAHAQTSGRTFCVFLVDVDNLKNVNDAHGLRTGDRVLAALAERLRATLEQPGLRGMRHDLARYDGDALLLLAAPCTLREGESVAEALRFHVADAPLHETVGVTVSIAVAQHRIGESIDELLARTERALHTAKQFGRDRVELSASPDSRPQRARVRALGD